MKKYIEQLRRLRIPENKGFECVGLESFFTPLLKTDITVVKRRVIPLTLVEETILRIAQCGVTDIDEIAGSMGLDRNIIEITLADLHVKDIAYITANKCLITGKGQQALSILSLTKRETAIIRGVYANVANDTFSSEPSKYIVERF